MFVPLIRLAMCPRSALGSTRSAGDATARTGRPALRAHAVHIDQLFSRALEAFQENPSHPAYQFVAKITVLLSLLPQMRSIEFDQFRRLGGAGREVPLERREQP